MPNEVSYCSTNYYGEKKSWRDHVGREVGRWALGAGRSQDRTSEMEARMRKYEEELVEYERLKALKDSKIKGYSSIKTGHRPRMPRLQDFSMMRREDVKGFDWWRYGEEVVLPNLKPEVDRFIEQKQLSLNNNGFRPLLIQDGASIHTKSIKNEYFQTVNCDILNWPGNSPDLNPIEHIWDYIRRRIAREHGFLKADEVRSVWQQMWDEVPLEVINWAMDR